MNEEIFKEAVFRHKIHKILTNMMLKNEPYLAREAVSCLKNLLVCPSGTYPLRSLKEAEK